MMRLQKLLALCGKASRRKAEEMIKSGRVCVNGSVVTEMGVTVDENNDTVTLDGVAVKMEREKRYIILNKPKGYITTVTDNFDRKTVMELVEDIPERIYPVGRLDYDTEGLLIMTNDGDFANCITHPRNKIEKVYIARVKGGFDEEKAEKLRNGVKIDGSLTAPAKVKILKVNENSVNVRVVIHEGRNRQVKKMFEAVGCFVTALKRTAVGSFKLGDIKSGEYREFTRDEMNEATKLKAVAKDV